MSPFNQPEPSEAPPAYVKSTAGQQPKTSHQIELEQHQAALNSSSGSHLTVPHGDHDDDDLSTDDEDGHTLDDKTRRSIDMDLMELPKGWVREFDAKTQHVYYVDTTKTPPRAIWVHPYEPEYLQSIPDSDRTRLFGEPNQGSADHASTSSGNNMHHNTVGSSTTSQTKAPEKRTFGRKLKDKMTGSTHEERQIERKKRAEQELKIQQEHIRRRNAMMEAARNGTYAPQYAAPTIVRTSYDPYGCGGRSSMGYGPYGYGNSMGYGGYGGYGGRGYYGGGGGAGMGMGAGLLGGVLLGGLLF